MTPIDKADPIIRQLVETTVEQMEDGGLEPTLDELEDFTADYPASAWLAEFRVKGGTADDDQANKVEEAVMAAAKDMLD